MHPCQQFDDECRAIGIQRMQGVGELTNRQSIGRQILQHQREAAGDGIEGGAVAGGHIGELGGKFAVEPHLGRSEAPQLTDHPGGCGLGGHLDEHGGGHILTGQCQSGARRGAGVPVEQRHGGDGPPEQGRQVRRIQTGDVAGDGARSPEDAVGCDTLHAAPEVCGQPECGGYAADLRRHRASLQINSRM